MIADVSDECVVRILRVKVYENKLISIGLSSEYFNKLTALCRVLGRRGEGRMEISGSTVCFPLCCSAYLCATNHNAVLDEGVGVIQKLKIYTTDVFYSN
jgi:hypothetical protein